MTHLVARIWSSQLSVPPITDFHRWSTISPTLWSNAGQNGLSLAEPGPESAAAATAGPGPGAAPARRRLANQCQYKILQAYRGNDQWASGISLSFKDRILAPSLPFVPSSAGLGELPSSCSMIQAYGPRHRPGVQAAGSEAHQYLLEQGGISEYGSRRVLTAQSLLQPVQHESEQSEVIFLSARRASLPWHHSSPIIQPGPTQIAWESHPMISDLLSENTPQRSIWQSVMETQRHESVNVYSTARPISLSALVSAADKFLHGLPINLPPYCDTECQTPLQHPGGTTHLATKLLTVLASQRALARSSQSHERCCMELKPLI
eukprot:768025-Hanusia_phi.AAC.4